MSYLATCHSCGVRRSSGELLRVIPRGPLKGSFVDAAREFDARVAIGSQP